MLRTTIIISLREKQMIFQDVDSLNGFCVQWRGVDR